MRIIAIRVLTEGVTSSIRSIFNEVNKYGDFWSSKKINFFSFDLRKQTTPLY